MKTTFGVLILLLFSFLLASKKYVDTTCSLSEIPEWSVTNNDICLKVNRDSLLWAIYSNKADIPTINKSAVNKLFLVGKISSTYCFPLFQNLSLIHEEKNVIFNQKIVYDPLLSIKMIY